MANFPTIFQYMQTKDDSEVLFVLENDARSLKVYYRTIHTPEESIGTLQFTQPLFGDTEGARHGMALMFAIGFSNGDGYEFKSEDDDA